MFDYKLIEALSAVINEGGFDKAAKKLFITQSAVSQRIKALEDMTGSILISRKAPHKPTYSGELFLKHFNMVNQLENDLNEKLKLSDKNTQSLAVGINADSLATWFIDTVEEFLKKREITLDIHIDDQDETHKLLKKGIVSGCISSSSKTVQGCSATFLGKMEYKMAASQEFNGKYFHGGFTSESLQKAPAVIFNRKDELHDRFIKKFFPSLYQYPKHYVPSSETFADFIKKGLGYGMIPVLQSQNLFEKGKLIELVPGSGIFVDLYWHSWNLKSQLLDELKNFLKTKINFNLN